MRPLTTSGDRRTVVAPQHTPAVNFCGKVGKLLSVKMMTSVFESKLAPTDKFVLLVLADHASDDGCNSWPSVETICRKTSLSERSVRGALASLRKKGQIVIQQYPNRHRPTTYQITLGRPAESAPLKFKQGVQQVQGRPAAPADQGCSSCIPEVQLLHPNHPEPSKNHPEPSQLAPELWSTIIPINDWPEFKKTWDEFVIMRKKKVPMTPHAAELIQRELIKLYGKGHDPIRVLEQSIMNGWRGVFEIKEERQHESHHERRSRKSLEAIAQAGVDSLSSSPPRYLHGNLPPARK